jgi:hypothetical protein
VSIRVALSAAFLIAGITAASAGVPGTVKKDGTLACPSEEVFWKFLEIGQNEPDVAFKYAAGKRCGWIKEDSQVFVEKTTWKGLACIRPKGQVDCLWTNMEQVDTK